MNERQKKYLKRLKDYVAKKGGKCLSEEYINNYTKLKFQCNESHIWESTPSNIINGGTWCPTCSHINHRLTEKERLRAFNNILKIAKSKNGECLSFLEEYKNITSKLKFKCTKNHKWEANAFSILNNKWCFECHLDSTRNNINDIIKLVESKGGKLLTKRYKNNRQKLKVKCSEGHIWITDYNHLLKGNWCHKCFVLNQNFLTEEERIKGLNDMCKIAEDKGGKCLSSLKEYKSVNSKLRFQCIKNHEWSALAYVVKTRTWCPICCQSLSEKLFRIIIEKFFNCEFPSCRPEWLKNKYGNRLQIDGYNEELKIGFEYQGEQHFIFSSHFYKTIEKFERNKQNDRTKKKILSNKNIFMFYPTYKLKKENYLSFIYSKIKNTKYSKLSTPNLKININKLYKLL